MWWRVVFVVIAMMAGENAMAQLVQGGLPRPVVKPVQFMELPNWNHTKARQAMLAFHESCSMQKGTAPQAYGLTMTLPAWNQLCHSLLRKNPNDAKRLFEEYFEPYKVTIAANESARGLLTGYYTPLVKGSLVQTKGYNVPIYGLPKTLELQRSFTRQQIDEGALKGKADVVMWLDDPIEAFFLHVQGSGYVTLSDGTMKKLVFAGKNGFPYTAIGRQFVEKGLVKAEDMSMQWLKEWLRANPQEMLSVLHSNQSYIYFAVENVGKHIRGAEGTPLMPMVSVAVDPAYVSYGLPLYLQTTLPQGKDFSALVIAQDTGSAIKGPLRADLYTGVGEKAASLAGQLKASTDFYALFPRKRSIGY
jgi:membrane-bound lytic murein transglycosylase A